MGIILKSGETLTVVLSDSVEGEDRTFEEVEDLVNAIRTTAGVRGFEVEIWGPEPSAEKFLADRRLRRERESESE